MMEIEILNIYCSITFLATNNPIVSTETYQYRVTESSAYVPRERIFLNSSVVGCVYVTIAVNGDFHTFSFN